MAALFILFTICVTLAAMSLSGCSKEKPINEGTILDKSHYPQTTTREWDCDKNVVTGKQHCEWEDGETQPERCTLTISEAGTKRTGEVAIPCKAFDAYQKGAWWSRNGSPSPTPSRR